MSNTRLGNPLSERVTAVKRYFQDMRAYQQDVRLPAPEATLLTTGLEGWLPGIVRTDVIANGRSPDYIAITFRKPNSADTTQRFCDPEFLLVAVLHVLHGGGFHMEAHGPDKLHHYWRINIRGRDTGLIGRSYALRLVVGTSIGLLTKEAWDHHDLRRSALGKVMSPRRGAPDFAKHGRSEMVEWSVTSFDASLRSGSPAFCSTSDEYRQVIEEAYRWLDTIPLGSSSQDLPAAAE